LHDCCVGVVRIQAGASVDERNSWAAQPIDFAAENKNEQIMSCLLAAGCSLKPSLCTLKAARNSNHMVLEMLIAAGADITACDGLGCAPIHHAACNPNVAVVRLLLDAGVDVNVLDNYGENAIFKACENPNMEVLDALLAAGVEWREVGNSRTICHAVQQTQDTRIRVMSCVMTQCLHISASLNKHSHDAFGQIARRPKWPFRSGLFPNSCLHQ
jgi:serine/threonine-protein phosphatase 6 regulatory ankyrin repeat subunit A